MGADKNATLVSFRIPKEIKAEIEVMAEEAGIPKTIYLRLALYYGFQIAKTEDIHEREGKTWKQSSKIMTDICLEWRKELTNELGKIRVHSRTAEIQPSTDHENGREQTISEACSENRSGALKRRLLESIRHRQLDRSQARKKGLINNALKTNTKA